MSRTFGPEDEFYRRIMDSVKDEDVRILDVTDRFGGYSIDAAYERMAEEFIRDMTMANIAGYQKFEETMKLTPTFSGDGGDVEFYEGDVSWLDISETDIDWIVDDFVEGLLSAPEMPVYGHKSTLGDIGLSLRWPKVDVPLKAWKPPKLHVKKFGIALKKKLKEMYNTGKKMEIYVLKKGTKVVTTTTKKAGSYAKKGYRKVKKVVMKTGAVVAKKIAAGIKKMTEAFKKLTKKLKDAMAKITKAEKALATYKARIEDLQKLAKNPTRMQRVKWHIEEYNKQAKKLGKAKMKYNEAARIREETKATAPLQAIKMVKDGKKVIETGSMSSVAGVGVIFDISGIGMGPLVAVGIAGAAAAIALAVYAAVRRLTAKTIDEESQWRKEDNSVVAQGEVVATVNYDPKTMPETEEIPWTDPVTGQEVTAVRVQDKVIIPKIVHKAIKQEQARKLKSKSGEAAIPLWNELSGTAKIALVVGGAVALVMLLKK